MRWIGSVNLALVGILLLVTIAFIFFNPDESPLVFTPHPEQKEIPKSPFKASEEFFQEMGEGMFALNWIPPQMQLPDLRDVLIFYGRNLRPDALNGNKSFHIALKGCDERIIAREGARVYLIYHSGPLIKEMKRNFPPKEKADHEKNATAPLWGEVSQSGPSGPLKCTYAFSPGNQATPLWLEAKYLSDQTLDIRVSMLDEKGILVSSPQEFRQFHINAQEFTKPHAMGWDLGKYRVDSTLLVRQKARWVGSDLFLSMHGGDEFSDVQNKERIDFLDGDEPYSCFVCAGNFMIWKDNRWKVPCSDDRTDRYPLMLVKRIEEKIITFELWDDEGKGKMLLNLIRTREPNGKPNLAQEMKFVGAKTWAQFVVECRNGSRMTLKLHDWLVLTQDGWQKLESPEQIDAYVNQKLIGPLFILDKIVKKNGKQVLAGHLFNSLRTEVDQIELASCSNTSFANLYRHIPMAPPQAHIKSAEIHLEGGDNE